MFGYVTPVKTELRQQDYVLYRSFYCGLCKSIGRHFGQLPRFATTYDVTFLSVLVFDQMNADVRFSEETCVGNPVKRHVIVSDNTLLEKLAAASVILSYYKLGDDVLDGDRKASRRFMRRLVRRAYERAVATCPGIDKAVRDGYAALRALESKNETNIDRVSDAFATLLKNVAAELTGETENEMLLKLCYNVGKFVYLIDAADDIDDDHKKGSYNPFLARFPGYQNRQQFFTDNAADIGFILSSTVNRAISFFNELNCTQSYTLLKNIIHLGLRSKVQEVLSSGKKLDRPRI